MLWHLQAVRQAQLLSVVLPCESLQEGDQDMMLTAVAPARVHPGVCPAHCRFRSLRLLLPSCRQPLLLLLLLATTHCWGAGAHLHKVNIVCCDDYAAWGLQQARRQTTWQAGISKCKWVLSIVGHAYLINTHAARLSCWQPGAMAWSSTALQTVLQQSCKLLQLMPGYIDSALQAHGSQTWRSPSVYLCLPLWHLSSAVVPHLPAATADQHHRQMAFHFRYIAR